MLSVAVPTLSAYVNTKDAEDTVPLAVLAVDIKLPVAFGVAAS